MVRSTTQFRPLPPRRAFTLLELLVVVGIIGVLVSIAIPATSIAREYAVQAKCAANLRNIGMAMTNYVGEFEVFPPAYVFSCPYVMVNRGLQHWSDLLANRCPYPPKMYPAPAWPRVEPEDGLFTCQSIERGGLPPANTTSSGSDSNVEPGQTSGAPLDRQARRMAYTVNEALCPRPYMQGLRTDAWPRVMPIPEATRPYRFVSPSDIDGAGSTILVSEWNRNWRMVAGTDPYNSANNQMCMSYATVHGFARAGGGASTAIVTTPTGQSCALAVVNGSGGSDPYDAAFASRGAGGGLRRVRADEILSDPPIPGANLARPNWLGRNHRGETNFAYADGHVETQTLEQSVERFQWGQKFYSLSPGDDIVQ